MQNIQLMICSYYHSKVDSSQKLMVKFAFSILFLIWKKSSQKVNFPFLQRFSIL